MWRLPEKQLEGIPHGYSLGATWITQLVDRVSQIPERLLLCPWFRQLPIDRPVFIVGPFRSGTTVLEKIIAEHSALGHFWYLSNAYSHAPVTGYWTMRLLYALGILEGGEISSIHNPRVPFTVFSPYECEWIWAQSSKGLWDDDCHDITATADFSDPVFEHYLVSLIQRHLLVQGTPRFINKNPVHCLRMGYLQKLFPEARFVTIVRDPVDTVLSHYRTSAHMQRILFVDEQTQHLFQEELHVDMLTARIKTRHYERTLSLDKIHPLLGIANQWLDLEGAVLESAAHTPALADQVLALRYETLVSQPEQTLESIWDFIGLQGEEAEQITRAYAPQLSPSPAAALSAEEKKFLPRVREIVAPLATQLGYA